MKISRKRLNESYKLRFYKKQKGLNQGNLDHEEFFDTKAEAVSRYKEVFDRNAYSLNPTVWVGDGDNWKRLSEIEINESLKEDFEDYEDRLFYRKSDRLENSVEKRFPGWKIFVEGSWQCGIGSDFIYIYPPDDIKLEDDPLSIYLDGSFLDISNREILKLIAQEIKPVIQANESLNEDVNNQNVYVVEPHKIDMDLYDIVFIDNGKRASSKRFESYEDAVKFIKKNAKYNNWIVGNKADFQSKEDKLTDFGKSIKSSKINESLKEDDAVDKFSANLDPSLIIDVHEVEHHDYHAESLNEDSISSQLLPYVTQARFDIIHDGFDEDELADDIEKEIDSSYDLEFLGIDFVSVDERNASAYFDPDASDKQDVTSVSFDFANDGKYDPATIEKCIETAVANQGLTWGEYVDYEDITSSYKELGEGFSHLVKE